MSPSGPGTMPWTHSRGRPRKASRGGPPHAVLLLILVAFALRAGSLTAQSLWRDEVDALCYAFQFPHLVVQAVVPQTVGELSTPCSCPPPPLTVDQGQARGLLLERLRATLGPMIRQNGPLYFFLLRGWIAVAGHSEYALRFFSLVFGVLGVPLTYVLGCRLMGRTAAQVAALLAATSPYLVWYAQETKMYTLLPALALLAIYGLRRAVQGSGRRWWAVQVIATSLAFYTHIWSALLVPVYALFLLCWWPQWRGRWRGALLSMALLTLPYLPLALWQLPAALVERDTGFPRHSLGEMAQILLNGWSTGINGWGWPWGTLATGMAAVLGTVAPWVAGGRSSRETGPQGNNRECSQADRSGPLPCRTLRSPLLAGWLVVPLLGVWLVSLRQPLFTDRYLIWTAPAFYLLVGAGLATRWKGARWLTTFLLAVILITFAGNLWVQAVTPIKSDLRAVAAFVEQGYQPGDLLIFQIPHLRYTFDYYFGPSDYAWAEGLYTNHRQADGAYLLSERAAATRMAQKVWGYRTVWLVASEVEMWDERNLVQGWLEASGERQLEAHFARAAVYRYYLPCPQQDKPLLHESGTGQIPHGASGQVVQLDVLPSDQQKVTLGGEG